jgi:thiamine-monophosphate kinase
MPIPESELIRQIRRRARRAGGEVRLGIGDDCAVIRPKRGEEIVVTTDFSIEGLHFHRDWHAPESVGHRCLARGLSDIAAMGAQPIACFLSLALAKSTPQKWVDGFLRGFLKLAERYSCTLAGGDTSSSPSSIIADVMVLGSVPQSKAVLRSSAKLGDIIYVTGTLGGAAAELDRLRKQKAPRLRPAQRASLGMTSSRQFVPEPRVEIGQFLRNNKLAYAMIDVSDGLSTDLNHICEESGVGAILNSALLPVARNATLEQALHGGEDYELLFTAPAKAKVPVEIAGVPITEIGWTTGERGVYITDLRSKPKPLRPQGWEHFRKS